MLRRAYFTIVIDGVFCVEHTYDKQTRRAFQPLRLTELRLWAVVTPQTLWWKLGRRRRRSGHEISTVNRLLILRQFTIEFYTVAIPKAVSFTTLNVTRSQAQQTG